MSRNTMSAQEEREYADWLLELTQQARHAKQKQTNEYWHHVAERLLTAFGAGDPDEEK
ncbi:hypothetical protein [Gryllotalpicola ginsengisoli]|uniref:hypothetical protein n=1 Tax=Gryllotalpicola ginsengisoli TaxID=444608 RepID=UPI000424C278|nr:hypothetical protein [Gryllotalpicola ginsengisoli]